ncbi:MAG TPA: hypothetical protein VKA84_25970 [Gemmatimonadaceae bacterium]|nr:hypothetical protein [Gemmatimonadaceae bacterium]
MTRSTWTRLLGGAAVAAAALTLGAPAALRAQSVLEPVHVTAPATRADSLDKRATALYGSPSKWRQAAYLHQLAADARDPYDPLAVQDLVLAANIFYHLGDLSAARNTMVRAAVRAERRGDLVRAAIAYVDAGYVAIEQKDENRARDLSRKVRALADSPLLGDDQRAQIRNRMGYSELAAL